MFLFGKPRRVARVFAFAGAIGLTVGGGVAAAYVAGRLTAEATRNDETGRLVAISRPAPASAAVQHLAVAAPPSAAPVRLDMALLHAAAYQIPTPFRLADPSDSARDLDCLTAAVYYEARGETKAGQAAVAQVVLNRVRNRAFPKTVCAVVYQGAAFHQCQFSFACDGAAGGRRETGAWARAKSVASRALEGYVMPEVGGATHFHVAALGAIWGGQMVRIAQIGEHVFYSFSGHRSAIARGMVADNSSAPDADTTLPGPPADAGAIEVATAPTTTASVSSGAPAPKATPAATPS